MTHRLVLAMAVTSAMLPIARGADDVDKLIKTLCPSPVDNAVWAEKLVNYAAKELQATPKAQKRLYERAYEVGLRQQEGYPHAIRAAEAMLEVEPESRSQWQQKRLAVYARQLRAAKGPQKKEAGRAYLDCVVAAAEDAMARADFDEAVRLYRTANNVVRYYAPGLRESLAQKARDAGDRQELQREIKRRRTLLAAHPSNTANREQLIRLTLVELNEPSEAAKLLAPGVAPDLRTYVPLAGKSVDDLAVSVCLEMGDWYRSLAEDATREGKINVLSSAKACYERFVADEPDAVKRAIGQAKLTKTKDELDELGGIALPGGIYMTLKLAKDVELKLVRIPAGKFLMGSPPTEKGRRGDEGPQHWVTITKPFYMGVTPVTQAQYEAVMGKNPSEQKGSTYPVDRVSWDAATAFCRKASEKTGQTVRLPTEAEWEYACRAGTKTTYFFGNSPAKLGEYAWYKDNYEKKPHPVAEKKPNPWGLYDMYGLVHEWCRDYYAADYYKSSPEEDPQGAATASKHNERVIRSNGPHHEAEACRSAYHYKDICFIGHPYFGFRVVVPVGAN